MTTATTIEIVTTEITYQVWQAVEGEGHLPVGVPVTLEYLSDTDEGIFETPAKWRRFIFGNFAQGCDKGTHYLNGDIEPRAGILKKYCYELKQYKDRFVVAIGGGNYVKADPNNLEFRFTFDANNYRRGSDFCSAVEILVTATLKS